ncbi:hypothetical protein LTSEURB_3170, partial [Salmonella enterica subsp. enterica serovar Urbana str. R8-2977]
MVHERMRKPPEDHLPGAFFWRRMAPTMISA